jgi:hypothetical protein
VTDFTSELRAIAAALDLPAPARARILLELGGDLDDMHEALVGAGMTPAEARRRAIDVLVPEPATLAALVGQHRPFYQRLADGLADPLRHRLERAGLIAGVATLLAFALIVLSDFDLLVDPAAATIPLLALGAAFCGLALWKLFEVHVRRDHRPGRLRRGLGWLPAVATAAVVLALGGIAVDLYLVAGHLEAGAADRTSVLLAWLRRDAAMASLGLIVGSLAIALWIWLSASIARVEEAEADVLLTFRPPGGAP